MAVATADAEVAVAAGAESKADAGGHPVMFGGGNLPMRLLNAVNIAPICFSSASIRASVALLGLAVGILPLEGAPTVELAPGSGPVPLPAPALVAVLVLEVGPLEDMVIAKFRQKGVG